MKTNKEQKGEHTILIGGVKYVPEVSEDSKQVDADYILVSPKNKKHIEKALSELGEDTSPDWSEDCICWGTDYSGVSVCGLPCPAHSKSNKQDWKDRFDAFWFEKEEIIHGVAVNANDIKKFIASELSKVEKKAREEVIDEIKEEVIDVAMGGVKIEYELKGLTLYVNVMNMLEKLKKKI